MASSHRDLQEMAVIEFLPLRHIFVIDAQEMLVLFTGSVATWRCRFPNCVPVNAD